MEDKLSPILYSELSQKLFVNPALQISDELKDKLRVFESQFSLEKFLKEEKVYLELKAVYSPLLQQVLRYVAAMWSSYYKSLVK